MIRKNRTLTKADFQEIQDGAKRLWLDRASKDPDTFSSSCIVDSFVAFTAKHGIIVENGELYEKEKTKKST